MFLNQYLSGEGYIFVQPRILRAHPTASAGATLCAARLSGKLKGDTMETGPIGKRRTMLWKPSVRFDRSIGAHSPAGSIDILNKAQCFRLSLHPVTSVPVL